MLENSGKGLKGHPSKTKITYINTTLLHYIRDNGTILRIQLPTFH